METLEKALLIGGIVVVGGVGIYLATRKPSVAGLATFGGFKQELIQASGQTTTRQRDGATAYDFWNFPLVNITPDIFGAYQVTWGWTNMVDGIVTFTATGIVNSFDITANGVNQITLIDNRASPPRDPARGGSIAFGDIDGYFDGLWHRFQSSVNVTVKSPSGASATVTGALDETFKSIGKLSATFGGWNTQLKES